MFLSGFPSLLTKTFSFHAMKLLVFIVALLSPAGVNAVTIEVNLDLIGNPWDGHEPSKLIAYCGPSPRGHPFGVPTVVAGSTTVNGPHVTKTCGPTATYVIVTCESAKAGRFVEYMYSSPGFSRRADNAPDTVAYGLYEVPDWLISSTGTIHVNVVCKIGLPHNPPPTPQPIRSFPSPDIFQPSRHDELLVEREDCRESDCP